MGVCRSSFQTSPGRKRSSSSRGRKIRRSLSCDKLLQTIMDLPFHQSEYCMIRKLCMQRTLAASARHPANPLPLSPPSPLHTHTHTHTHIHRWHATLQLKHDSKPHVPYVAGGRGIPWLPLNVDSGAMAAHLPLHMAAPPYFTNIASMQTAIAQAGSLTFQSAKARLDRVSSLML